MERVLQSGSSMNSIIEKLESVDDVLLGGVTGGEMPKGLNDKQQAAYNFGFNGIKAKNLGDDRAHESGMACLRLLGRGFPSP